MFGLIILTKKELNTLLQKFHNDGAKQGYMVGIIAGRADARNMGCILPGESCNPEDYGLSNEELIKKYCQTKKEQIKEALQREGLL